MATALGCSVVVGYAGSSIAPCGDVTRTTSPTAMPSVFAVSVAISTQPSNATDPIGCGAPCRPGPRPAARVLDSQGRLRGQRVPPGVALQLGGRPAHRLRLRGADRRGRHVAPRAALPLCRRQIAFDQRLPRLFEVWL